MPIDRIGASSTIRRHRRWHRAGREAQQVVHLVGDDQHVVALPPQSTSCATALRRHRRHRSGSETPESCRRTPLACPRHGPPRSPRSTRRRRGPRRRSARRGSPGRGRGTSGRRGSRSAPPRSRHRPAWSAPCTASPAPASCRWSRTVAPARPASVGLGEEFAEGDAMVTVAPLRSVLQELGRLAELQSAQPGGCSRRAGWRCSADRHRGRSTPSATTTCWNWIVDTGLT